MKQQLMIVAIAFAVSGAAFAATEGDHEINLRVDAPSSTLEIIAPDGILDGATNWIFDTDKNTNNGFSKTLGDIGVSGSGFTTQVQCLVTISSVNGEWQLKTTGATAGIKYGLTSRFAGMNAGYANLRNYSETFSRATATISVPIASGTCRGFTDLGLVTEPFPATRARPATGTYTDTIQFTVSAR